MKKDNLVTLLAGGRALHTIIRAVTMLFSFVADRRAEPRSSHEHRTAADRQDGDHGIKTHLPGSGDRAAVPAQHGTCQRLPTETHTRAGEGKGRVTPLAEFFSFYLHV